MSTGTSTKTLLIVFVFTVTLSALVSGSYNPDRFYFAGNGGDSFSRFYRSQRNKVCVPYQTACNPHADTCCGVLKCTNLAKGRCMFPEEKCFCQANALFNVDDDWKSSEH